MKSLSKTVVSRRTALLLGFGAIVAACTGRGSSASLGSPSPSPTASSVSTPACIVTPSETEGPYFVDERLNRSDISTDPGNGTRRSGVPLDLTFQVSRASSGGCTAMSGAQVDVWHCDAAGIYSDVSAQSSVGQRFLRGYQLTDANGAARFAVRSAGVDRSGVVQAHRIVRVPLPVCAPRRGFGAVTLVARGGARLPDGRAAAVHVDAIRTRRRSGACR